jgi:hypothetical protein
MYGNLGPGGFLMKATSNARRALRLITWAALMLGAFSCEQASTGGGTSNTAGAGGSGAASTSGAGGGSIGSGFSLPDAGAGGDPCAADAATDGPDPQETPCDRAHAGACDLPPSVCVNTEWLIYHANPECINGLYPWEKKVTACCCPSCCCANGSCLMSLTK